MYIFVAVKHGLIFMVLLLLCLFSSAQNRPVGQDVMRLVSSTRGVILDQKIVRHYNPVYEHKGNTLMADSGDFRRDTLGREFFDAYGNIVITQPSGTVIYADRLNYEASIQHAVLTRNVRVVDGQSVLTTNYLTYNFRDQRGTYTNGGRIISGQDTITSQNGYYFERTKDSYFREKVIVRSPDVEVFTDTMRYNSVTRDNFFYGPTNIKGRNGENLYTERGVYNTGTGIAKFNKNNLYTETSKFLKGDSLYYDRSIGHGEAFRNVVFVDTVDKWYGNSGYGKYISADESITLTDKPLVKLVVSNDTTETESSITETVPESEENLSRRERRQRQRELEQQEQEELELESDSLLITQRDSVDFLPRVQNNVDTVYLTADTIFSRMILTKDYQALDLKLDREGGQLVEDDDIDYGDDDVDAFDEDLADELHEEIAIVSDSLGISQDTIQKVVQEVKQIDPPRRIPQKDSLTIEQTLKSDSTLRQQVVVPGENEAEKIIAQAMESVMKQDTIPQDSTLVLSDTARTRIVNAYYNVRLYKSDLQAVADSVYYGMQDSMFRFMGQPMIWAEGSQISGDTIFMQMVNQRLDNALLKNNALMVNAVLDSAKFNQLKGRRITVFFENNHIERVFVDGNAENLSFNVDEELGIIREMFHDKSSRIAIRFRDKKVYRYLSVKRIDQQLYPLKMVTQENEILPGFIWRPQDRPKSRDDMMNRKREIGQPTTQPDNSEEGAPQDDENLQDTEEEVEWEEESESALTEDPYF